MLETDRARDALQIIDAGCTREEWVKVGMAAKAAGLSFDEFNNWSESGGNYKGESDCRAVWESFKDGGITAASLFGIARAQGWQDSSKPTQPSNKAADVWAECQAAPENNPYIKRKGGTPDGLRIYPPHAPPLVIRGQNMAGWLVVPCWDGQQLQTLQFIPAQGDKLNLSGASFNNGFFTVGTISDRVFICEGIGQAWAVNQATHAAAVVCFGAGRMKTVAAALRAKYPAAGLVVVPDRGKEDQAAEIAAAVGGQWLELPQDKPANYDVNDFLQDNGISALTALLERVNAPPMREQAVAKEAAQDDAANEPPFRRVSLHDVFTNPSPPQKYVWGGRVPFEALTLLAAHGGTGKSLFALQCAAHTAAGKPFLGLPTGNVPRRCFLVLRTLQALSGGGWRESAGRTI